LLLPLLLLQVITMLAALSLAQSQVEGSTQVSFQGAGGAQVPCRRAGRQAGGQAGRQAVRPLWKLPSV
jgi:hypothetical protein